jgi:hypothetical protein
MGPSRNGMVLRGISVDRLADRKALLRAEGETEIGLRFPGLAGPPSHPLNGAGP